MIYRGYLYDYFFALIKYYHILILLWFKLSLVSKISYSCTLHLNEDREKTNPAPGFQETLFLTRIWHGIGGIGQYFEEKSAKTEVFWLYMYSPLSACGDSCTCKKYLDRKVKQFKRITSISHAMVIFCFSFGNTRQNR